MRFRLTLSALFLSIFLGNSFSVNAAGFWRTGDINRVLTDRINGGCMVQISSPMGYPCTETGWVSLDCEKKYGDFGREMYAAALMAFSLEKKVSVYVHDHEKHGPFCVARRLDVLK